jgi:hypothetical protein
MSEDKDTLQTEEAPVGELEVTEEIQPEAKEEQPPAPEFATKAELNKTITELRQELTEAKEHVKRFQSIADSRGAEAKTAFASIRSLESQIQSLNNQALSTLDPEEQRLRRIEMRLQQTDRQPQQPQYPTEILEDLREAGVEVSDSRIDWAQDATNPIQGYKRFKASIERIKSEVVKTSKSKGDDLDEEQAEALERAKAQRETTKAPRVETRGLTSARSRSWDDIQQGYIDGTIPSAEYAKARKERYGT